MTVVSNPGTTRSLEESFRVSDDNGKLCEVRTIPQQEPCTRDATHAVTLRYPEDHACEVKYPYSACWDHAMRIRDSVLGGRASCAHCGQRPDKCDVTPIGGR